MSRHMRNSNIELLRIIAISLIIAHHFVGQNGALEYQWSLNDFALTAISSAGRIAVNIFLIIGVWYMIESNFRASRIISLYGELFFYSFVLALLMLLLNRNNISVKDFLRCLTPFLGRNLWFASAYITLLFFKPILDRILLWEKKHLMSLTILILIFVAFISTIPRPEMESSYICDTLWFPLVYLMIGYIKKYAWPLPCKNKVLLCGGGYNDLYAINRHAIYRRVPA